MLVLLGRKKQSMKDVRRGDLIGSVAVIETPPPRDFPPVSGSFGQVFAASEMAQILISPWRSRRIAGGRAWRQPVEVLLSH
jgi:hypothetical protein